MSLSSFSFVLLAISLGSAYTVEGFVTSSSSSQQIQRQKQPLHANDPLFDEDDSKNTNEMSPSLPFLPRPKLLDGSLAGDVGFEYVYGRHRTHDTWHDDYFTFRDLKTKKS